MLESFKALKQEKGKTQYMYEILMAFWLAIHLEQPEEASRLMQTDAIVRGVVENIYKNGQIYLERERKRKEAEIKAMEAEAKKLAVELKNKKKKGSTKEDKKEEKKVPEKREEKKVPEIPAELSRFVESESQRSDYQANFQFEKKSEGSQQD